MLSIIERVIILQEVDIFRNLTTEDLAHIALITEEVHFPEEHVIYREGDISDSMYLVIDGKIRLTRAGVEVMTAGSGEVFGSWALLDDEIRVVTAKTLTECRLLRIDKEDFIDLLADNILITQGLIKGLASRLRTLVSRTLPDQSERKIR